MFPTAPKVDALQAAVGGDALRFLPELALCVGIVAMLLCRLLPLLDRVHLGGIALLTVATALYCAVLQIVKVETGEWTWAGPYFGGMLSSDPFAGLMRCLVLGAALLTVLLTQLTRIPDAADSADFHALLLGGTLGMMLMASANHLLMVFVAVEMASLPGYALAGFLKGKRTGSEAALKYVVYGAGASGVMLYGITLIAGIFGTGSLPDIAAGVGHRGLDLPVLAGFSFVLIGLGFKLAAVPFHFWCPDVFEGAAAEVAGFLSVASKAAAVALTLRLLLVLNAASPPWAFAETLGLIVGVIGAVTVTFGNLAAFPQTNLKRLLAYSTVAHAGYMLLGVSTLTHAGASGVLFYLAAYIVMNLGAFACVALVRNATGAETIDACRGLAQRSPVLAVTLAVFLLSLLGLPPLAGFAGKFQVFEALYEAGRAATASGPPRLGTVFYALLAIGAVNTAMSAYYYLKIARAALLDEPTDPTPIRTAPMTSAYLALLAAALLALGVIWNPLTDLTGRAVATFGK